MNIINFNGSYIKIFYAVLIRAIPMLFVPVFGYAADGDEIADPIYRLIEILSGPVGVALLVGSLGVSGAMFYWGKWDVNRLVATAIGSGLIFGGVSIADFIGGQ